MKKLIGSLITAFLAVTAAHAKPTATPPTNVVTRINIQLTFNSQLTNITTFATSTTTHKVGGKTTITTNVFTIQTAKAVSTPIATKDVIAAIAPGAPKGAYLALVQSTNAPSYFAIRVGNTNFAIVTEITQASTNEVSNGKASHNETTGNETVSANYKKLGLVQLGLNTATLSFNVTAVSLQTATGDTITIGGITFPVFNSAFNVIGTGTDSIGSGEIVTGTITSGGTSLGN